MSTPPRSLEDILGKDWDKSQPPPTEETLAPPVVPRSLEDILGTGTEEGETEEVEEPKIEDPNFINRLAERQRDIYAKYPALAQAIKSTVGGLPPGLDMIGDVSPIELEKKQTPKRPTPTPTAPAITKSPTSYLPLAVVGIVIVVILLFLRRRA